MWMCSVKLVRKALAESSCSYQLHILNSKQAGWMHIITLTRLSRRLPREKTERCELQQVLNWMAPRKLESERYYSVISLNQCIFFLDSYSTHQWHWLYSAIFFPIYKISKIFISISYNFWIVWFIELFFWNRFVIMYVVCYEISIDCLYIENSHVHISLTVGEFLK